MNLNFSVISKIPEWTILKTDTFIDLKETLFSGQVFQFKMFENNIFIGNVYNDLAILKQVDDKVYYIDYTETIENHLRRFFNLDMDIYIPNSKRGLRFLTNDIYSTIFSFICSSNNHISRISKMVHYIYSKGKEIQIQLPNNFDKAISNILATDRFYLFPDLEILQDIEDELKINKFGYRSQYICNAARYLTKNNHNFEDLDYETSRQILMQIKGIGRKVADCISLIGLRHFHVVPLDTHIIKYSKSHFNLKINKVNDKIYSEIQKMWIKKYGEYAGIVQMFAFKEMVDLRNKKQGKLKNEDELVNEN